MERSQSVVVIGASAGGLESLREVVGGLLEKFPAPVFVVLHVPPFKVSALPSILSRSGPLPASHAEDRRKFKPGHIYVAPPDHHLLIDGRSMGVKKGPRENRFRPSIDALFRSAAYSYGSNVIGIVLSGALDDGTSGLWTVKRLGGIAIVQKPDEARFESMPLSALAAVDVDHTVSAKEIGPLVTRLLAAPRRKDRPVKKTDLRKRVKAELAIAAEGGAFQKGIMEMGKLTPFTCPECHGVLVEVTEAQMTRYRCHTGHAYSGSALLEGVMESTGEMLWQVMRSLEEAVMLVEEMAQKMKHAGDTRRAKIYSSKARELEARSKTFHDVVLKHESLSEENLAPKRDGD